MMVFIITVDDVTGQGFITTTMADIMRWQRDNCKEVFNFIYLHLITDVCLCCSAHTSGCVVDGLGAKAAF